MSTLPHSAPHTPRRHHLGIYGKVGSGRNKPTNVIDEEATVAPVAAPPAILAATNLFGQQVRLRVEP